MARPYQPSLLRLLHGLVAFVVAGCWISGLVVYSRFDGRWGRLPFNPPGDWVDVHGSIGVLLVLAAVPFVAYAFGPGRARLARAANAAVLAGLILAVASGLRMDEHAVRAGALQEPAYVMHVGIALLLTLAVLGHLGGVLARGGWPLARSMFSPSVKSGDLPTDWPAQLRRFAGRG